MSHIPLIPEDAPFTPEQRQWLNAFFLRMFPATTTVVSGPAVPVSILYASQTGNAQSLAKQLFKELKKGNFLPQLFDMMDYDRTRLAQEKHLLLITSTYGDGEPPDAASALHQWLHSDEAPSLTGLKFSVLALGDTSYPDFCKCGIEFDQRLAELGAERLSPRVDCDVEYDLSFKAWTTSLIQLLAPGEPSLPADSIEQEEQGFSKNRPFAATLTHSVNLNHPGSEKQTQHISFSLENSGLHYEVGDALGVVPLNPSALVDEILSLLPFSTRGEVTAPDGSEVSFRDALIHHYDLRTLNKSIIEKWQTRSGSPFLRSLVQSADKNAYEQFQWGRELIDLIIDYPADFTDAEEFLAVLRKLQPRLYSIASSPKVHPGEVHLTVSLVKYQSFGRTRAGVCSDFLTQLSIGNTAGVYIHSNSAFRLPTQDDTPMIMVGPGTGIAPFRAFLEERQATGAKGKNWLFFGNPHRATDFLYEEELSQFQRDGVLHRLETAFSRDQKNKIYVQDRIREHGAELWQWLESGAAFYVCGDASRMAKDVDLALHDIIALHGGRSADDTASFVAQMKKDKRYLRDVY